jgi:ubiquinone/menaquinone biosynthesis C-methylase UbiE
MDGIFSKALQARRMIQRGETDPLATPAAEVVALGRRLEPFVTPEQLAAAEAGLAEQRWHKPTIELGVAEGYAKWAEGYDAEANPLVSLEEPLTLEVIGDVVGTDVLDAACGTGRYAIRLEGLGARVVGIDGSPEMLAVAGRRRDELGLSFQLRAADLVRLPFPEAGFDLVVCALALCHLSDLGPPVKEMARVLRPGGRLVVSDFHPFCLMVGWRTLFRRPGATYCIENHLHLVDDYVAALRGAGLQMQELREKVIDEALLPVLSEEEVERFRGWPAALVIVAKRGGD